MIEGREQIAVVAVFAQPDPTATNSDLVDLFNLFEYMNKFPGIEIKKKGITS